MSGSALTCLTADFKNAPKKSCKDTRLEESKQKEKGGGAGEGGHVPEMCKLGVPMREKAPAALLAKDDCQFKCKNNRDHLALNQNAEALTLKKISEFTLMLNKMDSDDEDEKKMSKMERKKAIKDLSVISKKRVELQSEADRLVKEGTQEQVLAHCDQIGDLPNTPKQKPVDNDVVMAQNHQDDLSTIADSHTPSDNQMSQAASDDTAPSEEPQE